MPDGLDDALAGPADRRWARGARAISRGSTTSPTGRGYAAVGERDDAGDRGPGAVARATARSGRCAGSARPSGRWARSSSRRRAAWPCSANGGKHYLLYSFAPSHLVFNGGLQAVIGLRDAGALLHSSRARRLFQAGDRAARREVGAFDTGAWSLYSAQRRGVDAELPRADRELPRRALRARQGEGLLPRERALRALRARADEDRACAGLTPVERRPHDDGAVPLSKVSSVKVRVWGTRGMSVSRDFAKLPRGTPHVRLAPAGARPLPRADRGPRAERARGGRDAHGQGQAAQAQAQAEEEEEEEGRAAQTDQGKPDGDAAAAASRRKPARPQRRARRCAIHSRSAVSPTRAYTPGLSGPRAALAEARRADDAQRAADVCRTSGRRNRPGRCRRRPAGSPRRASSWRRTRCRRPRSRRRWSPGPAPPAACPACRRPRRSRPSRRSSRSCPPPSSRSRRRRRSWSASSSTALRRLQQRDVVALRERGSRARRSPALTGDALALAGLVGADVDVDQRPGEGDRRRHRAAR